MFETGMRLFLVITIITWMLWAINMIGDVMVPRPDRAGPPPEIPLTPIYKVKE